MVQWGHSWEAIFCPQMSQAPPWEGGDLGFKEEAAVQRGKECTAVGVLSEGGWPRGPRGRRGCAAETGRSSQNSPSQAEALGGEGTHRVLTTLPKSHHLGLLFTSPPALSKGLNLKCEGVDFFRRC